MSETTPIGIVLPSRRGPVEGEHTIGFDADAERRPGVPMTARPSETDSVEGRPILTQEEQRGRRLHRAGLTELTPVFGTAQPYGGVSGAIRRTAYRIPEHDARHWMLLLLADRMNVTEDRLGSLVDGGGLSDGARGVAERAREHPLMAAGVAVAGLWFARRLVSSVSEARA